MSSERRETYWSRFARRYDAWAEFVLGRSLRREIADRLRQERDLGDALELGCGTGYFTRVLAENATRVLATDLSDEMLEVARTRLAAAPNVTFARADCQATSFTAGRFDTVLIANVLHVLDDPDAALRECRRLLKDDGLLLVIVYTDVGMAWHEKLGIAARYFVTFGLPPPSGMKNYSREELGDLAAEAGFDDAELSDVGTKPHALYLRATKTAGALRRAATR